MEVNKFISAAQFIAIMKTSNNEGGNQT